MSKSRTNVYHKTTHRTGKNSKFISYTKLNDGEALERIMGQKVSEKYVYSVDLQKAILVV